MLVDDRRERADHEIPASRDVLAKRCCEGCGDDVEVRHQEQLVGAQIIGAVPGRGPGLGNHRPVVALGAGPGGAPRATHCRLHSRIRPGGLVTLRRRQFTVDGVCSIRIHG